MSQPRYHGCKESHVQDRWGGNIALNTLVNAYVRVGGKWTVVGEICTACGDFRPGITGSSVGQGLKAAWDDQKKRSGYLAESKDDYSGE